MVMCYKIKSNCIVCVRVCGRERERESSEFLVDKGADIINLKRILTNTV